MSAFLNTSAARKDCSQQLIFTGHLSKAAARITSSILTIKIIIKYSDGGDGSDSEHASATTLLIRKGKSSYLSN